MDIALMEIDDRDDLNIAWRFKKISDRGTRMLQFPIASNVYLQSQMFSQEKVCI